MNEAPQITWKKTAVYWTAGRRLFVSVPFTWNLPGVFRVLQGRSFFWDDATVGGPAVRLMPGYLAGLDNVTESAGDCPGALQRHNPLATRTTLGCPRRCSYCAVSIIEPTFKELNEWPAGPVLCDNNILAASAEHFGRVCDRLETYKWADFNQGLDCRLLTDFHAERLKRIGRPLIRLALDSMKYADQWADAFGRLRRAGFPLALIRSYALVGYDTDPAECWARCRFIESHKIKALPMWHHTLDQLAPNIVRPDQAGRGWNDYERRRLMAWFYKHRETAK